MLKTYLYIPEELDHQIEQTAKREQKSKADVIRRAIKRGLPSPKEKTRNDAEVLLDLANLAKKLDIKGPRDLSVNHDYYLWGGDKKNPRIRP